MDTPDIHEPIEPDEAAAPDDDNAERGADAAGVDVPGPRILRSEVKVTNKDLRASEFALAMKLAEEANRLGLYGMRLGSFDVQPEIIGDGLKLELFAATMDDDEREAATRAFREEVGLPERVSFAAGADESGQEGVSTPWREGI